MNFKQFKANYPTNGYDTYINNRYYIPFTNKDIIYDTEEQRILNKDNDKDKEIILKIKLIRLKTIIYLRTPLGYLKYYEHFKTLREREPNKPLNSYLKINWNDLYEGLKWV